MRKRYQRGSVVQSSDGRYWVGKYREDGRHKSKSLGKVGEVSKSKAQELFEEIRKPSNEPTFVSDIALSKFVETVYFPFYRRKWKRSTLMTNQDRIRGFVLPEFGKRKLRSFTQGRTPGLFGFEVGKVI